MEYLFLDNLELAKENFIKCLEEDLEDQTALYNVVYCFEFLDQNDEAISFLDNYINGNPYSEIAWHQCGRLNYNLKKYDDALKNYYAALAINKETGNKLPFLTGDLAHGKPKVTLLTAPGNNVNGPADCKKRRSPAKLPASNSFQPPS